ncbi:hypothetical protein [Streptomyces sp. NPDC015125]|uniref:hypothetical protein n=1 Tax=Streptomyces sp. NPDC015125 TaxID=3364938 RepID=UPI0036F5BC64
MSKSILSIGGSGRRPLLIVFGPSTTWSGIFNNRVAAARATPLPASMAIVSLFFARNSSKYWVDRWTNASSSCASWVSQVNRAASFRSMRVANTVAAAAWSSKVLIMVEEVEWAPA